MCVFFTDPFIVLNIFLPKVELIFAILEGIKRFKTQQSFSQTWKTVVKCMKSKPFYYNMPCIE